MLRSLDDFTTAGGVVASLQRGARISTDVYDPDKSKAAGPIYLEEGDELCGECETLITTKEYPGADYGNVLGRLKLKYGRTLCAECHGKVCLNGSGETEDHERPKGHAD